MSLSGRVVDRLPRWIRLSPLDAFLSGAFGAGGLLTLIGYSEPTSIEQVLPLWGRILWAVCLVIGCSAWIAGLTSVRENNGSFVLTRMPALLFGLYLISIGSVAYGAVVILFAGWSGLVTGVVLLAISGALFVHRVNLARRYRDQNGSHGSSESDQ